MRGLYRFAAHSGLVQSACPPPAAYGRLRAGKTTPRKLTTMNHPLSSARPTRRLAQLSALILLASLAACGGGGVASSGAALTPQEQIAQLEASGSLPSLDRTDSISGIDANANGVRDDIEQYIEKKYAEPSQRAAAMQTASSCSAVSRQMRQSTKPKNKLLQFMNYILVLQFILLMQIKLV